MLKQTIVCVYLSPTRLAQPEPKYDVLQILDKINVFALFIQSLTETIVHAYIDNHITLL